MAGWSRTLSVVLFLSVLSVSLAKEKKRRTFFHLSDLHLDLSYNGQLSKATLCRDGKHAERSQSPTSGTFGRYGCDSPVELVTSALQRLKKIDPDPSFILITGDFAAHEQEGEAVINGARHAMKLVRSFFPETNIIPTIGNNDCPSDFTLKEGHSKWLKELGRAFVLENEEEKQFKEGGFFVTSPLPGLKVVSLNTIYYSTEFSPEKDDGGPELAAEFSKQKDDPAGQFAWLKEVLEKAKKKKEKVYIAGHVPPGYSFKDELNTKRPDNWKLDYVEKYRKVVLDYHDVIQGQFFGHLHRDTFRVMYDDHDGGGTPSPKSFMLIASSISPIKNNNPSFRVFQLYSEDFVISDYQHYFLDVWLANTEMTAEWRYEYGFTEAYSLSPWPRIDAEKMGEMAQRLRFDNELSNDWLARHASFYIKGRHMFECTNHVFLPENAKDCFKNAHDD